MRGAILLLVLGFLDMWILALGEMAIEKNEDIALALVLPSITESSKSHPTILSGQRLQASDFRVIRNVILPANSMSLSPLLCLISCHHWEQGN